MIRALILLVNSDNEFKIVINTTVFLYLPLNDGELPLKIISNYDFVILNIVRKIENNENKR